MKLNKKALKLPIALFLIYIIFGLFLYINQKSMIYYPDDQDFEACQAFSDYEKKTFGGTRFYFQPQSEREVLIHYHGNAGSTCDRAYFRDIFEQSDRSLIFVEYAGYSADDKNPSKELILKDVENIDQFVQERDFKDVAVYGQSLGTGPASYHSKIGDVDSLIMVSSFSSIADLARSRFMIYPVSFLLTENYNNMKWLSDYKGEVLFIHGEEDRIIPYEYSKKLYKNIPSSKKEYVLIRDFGHNDIWLSQEFKNNLLEFKQVK